MAGGGESLFSLEVVVESVDSICISCYKPALAFRLLDFPTVVIRSERHELLTKETSLKIQSGKSCLFKMSKELLWERLNNTPLYIMLVDTCSTKTKLLASTTISLLNCFQNILENIENNGLDVPAVSGSKGEFSMYNLMGSQVATLKLGYRMFSFGLSMSGHVNLSLPKRIKQIEKENIVTEISPEKTENLKANGQFEPSSLPSRKENANIPDRELVIPDIPNENHNPPADATEAYTQADNTSKHSLTPRQKFHDPGSYSIHHHNNISRPPPLYYNSMSTSVTPKTQFEQKHFDNNLTKPRLMTSSLEKSLKNPNAKIDSKPHHCDASVQTCETSHTTQRNDISAPHVADHQMDLPLIEALLNELSLVRSKYVSNDLPQQVNEGTASPCKNKQIVHIKEKGNVPVKKGIGKKAKKGARPEPKKSLPTRANSKGVLISRQPIQFKKSSLKCGTTKTQKLREAFSKRNTYGEQDAELEADKVECIMSEQNKRKSSRQVGGLQIDSVVEQKSKQDFKDNKSTMTQSDQFDCKDIGIQVGMSDDSFPDIMPKQDSPLVSGGSNNVLGATYVNNVLPIQVDDNADKLFNGNFPIAKNLEGPSSKHKLLSNPSEFPTFSNISPTVPVARNTRYGNGEEPGEASQKKSRSLDSRLSDESVGLVSRPVGKVRSNRSGRKVLREKPSSSGERLSDESIGLASRPDGELHSNSDGSCSKELQGKPTTSGGEFLDESPGLVDEPAGLVNSNSDISSKESTRDKPISSGSRFSDESPSFLVSKSIGEGRSDSKRSSKESIPDKSIHSDGKLSDKSLDLASKSADHVMSITGYSDNFESDASGDTRDSISS